MLVLLILITKIYTDISLMLAMRICSFVSMVEFSFPCCQNCRLISGSIVHRSLSFDFDFVLTLFQLLRRNPERRLGASEKDAEDVRKQPFFRVRVILQTCIYTFRIHMPEVNQRNWK